MLLALTLGGLSAGQGFAYEIRPLHPVHEALTRLAYRCLRAAPASSEPLDCTALYADLPSTARMRWFSRPFSAEEKAARWSDDPSRELASLSAVRYGVALLGGCVRPIGDENRPAFTLEQGGLMCSSHYGALQFLHAMKSAYGEKPERTRERILDWAMLTYGLASGAISPDEPYCAYFQAHPSSISEDLAPADFQGCHDRIVAGRVQPAWHLQTLFALRCGHPTAPGRCTEFVGAEGRDMATASARGALLHLIQDSYSQSHAIRGPVQADGGYAARIDCHLPTDFYFYGPKTKDTHSQADGIPVRDEGCGPDAEADEAVTASATVLRFADQHAPGSEVRSYLERRVFGLVAPSA